jgi:hypothetical protein
LWFPALSTPPCIDVLYEVIYLPVLAEIRQAWHLPSIPYRLFHSNALQLHPNSSNLHEMLLAHPSRTPRPFICRPSLGRSCEHLMGTRSSHTHAPYCGMGEATPMHSVLFKCLQTAFSCDEGKRLGDAYGSTIICSALYRTRSELDRMSENDYPIHDPSFLHLTPVQVCQLHRSACINSA